MVDIAETETCVGGDPSRSMKPFDDLPNLCVRKQRIVVADPESLVEDRMAVENAWLGTIVNVWPTKTARVCQLQTDHQGCSRSSCPPVFVNQRFTKPR